MTLNIFMIFMVTIILSVSDNAPSFSNLPDTKSIPNTDASGTSVFTVTVDDIDTDDVSSLTVSMTANSMFSFDDSSREYQFVNIKLRMMKCESVFSTCMLVIMKLSAH